MAKSNQKACDDMFLFTLEEIIVKLDLDKIQDHDLIWKISLTTV